MDPFNGGTHGRRIPHDGMALVGGVSYASNGIGLVEAFDVRSGQPRWSFNPIPRPGEAGNDTWEGDSWSYSGQANV